MPKYSVRMHHGAPTVFEDEQAIFAGCYLVAHKPVGPDGIPQLDPDTDALRDVGLHCYLVDAETRFDTCYDIQAGGFPQERFAPLEILHRYLAMDPQARFILRVFVEPRGKESAWLQQHPDQWEVLEQRAKGVYATPSYASELWLRDASAFLRTLVGYVRDNGLQPRILGYMVCAGDSLEWVKIGPMEDWAGDYSAPMQEAFRRWLSDKYDSVQRLRAAWGDDSVSFEQDLVPSPDEQGEADLFLFKDPQRRRRAIDYFQCLADVVAADILRLCGVVKAACYGESLVGAFYGYLLEMVWNNGFFGQRLADADVAHMALPRSGHVGLKQVLGSPDVDFLSSPYSYGFRGIGGEGGFMGPAESVRLAGKLWISEEDTRTHLSGPDALYGQTHTAAQTCAVVKRQFANILTNAAGAWWCQWSAGSWNDPEVLAVMRRSLTLAQHHLTLPERGSVAEVAVVVDAESWLYRSTLNNFDIANWRNRTWGIARLGAPVDFLLLTDLLEDRARTYKFYYIWNVFHLTTAERVAIKKLLRRDGIVTLWVYAPGFVDEDLSVEHCQDLTGIALRLTPREWGVHIFLSNFEHPITQDLPTSTFWGTDMRLGPLITVDDTNALTLGTAVTSQGRCEPGFVLREDGDWCSVYSVAPNPPPGILRELARYAGVHIYSDSEDVFYADHNYLAIHTVRAAEKTIRLPHRADVWEVYEDRPVGNGCVEFRDYMAAGTTHVYYYGPAPRP